MLHCRLDTVVQMAIRASHAISTEACAMNSKAIACAPSLCHTWIYSAQKLTLGPAKLTIVLVKECQELRAWSIIGHKVWLQALRVKEVLHSIRQEDMSISNSA